MIKTSQRMLPIIIANKLIDQILKPIAELAEGLHKGLHKERVKMLLQTNVLNLKHKL